MDGRTAWTVNAGLRFDYLNAKLEAQSSRPGTFVPARQPRRDYWSSELEGHRSAPRRRLRRLRQRQDGHQGHLSRYVASQTVGFASQFNPLGGTVTGAGFSGTGADTRMWTDPNGDRIVQLVRARADEQPAVRHAALATMPAGDVQKGWFKRGYNWEYSASMQHELFPQVAVGAAYFRRRSATSRTPTRSASARATTIRTASPRRPTPASAPLGGQPICGLFDVRADGAPAARGEPRRGFRGYLKAVEGVQRHRPTRSARMREQAAARRRRQHGARPQRQLRDVRQPRRAILRQHAAVAHAGEGCSHRTDCPTACR